jgi:hypothetical protein
MAVEFSISGRVVRFGARAVGWAGLSAVALFGEIYWEYVLYLPHLVWEEPASRVARIVASSKPPITVALSLFLGAGVFSMALAALGSASKSAGRLRAAMICFGAHLVVILTLMAATSPLRTMEDIARLQGGMQRVRDGYATAYAAGLFLWQAWVSAAIAVLAAAAFPLLRKRAGLVPAVRSIAAPLLVLAPFSFAFRIGEWDDWIVLSALPLWLAAELSASRTRGGVRSDPGDGGDAGTEGTRRSTEP